MVCGSRCSSLRRRKTAVEEDCTYNGFHAIGQDRRTLKAAALEFALTQAQIRSQLQPIRQFGQGLLPHQAGAQARQLTLLQLAESLVQLVRDAAIEDAVAEKLDALVVRGAVAAMGECLQQQGRLCETVAEFSL
jgi:hypothetical protein